VWVVCGAGGCITYKTAWLLAQKLRRSMIDPKREPLEGVVELDQAKIPFRADDSLFYPVKSGKIRIAGAVEVIDRGTNQATPGRKGRNTRMLALAASGSPPLGGSGSPSIVSFNRNVANAAHIPPAAYFHRFRDRRKEVSYDEPHTARSAPTHRRKKRSRPNAGRRAALRTGTSLS
jgi:hypothetical protein